MSKQKNYNDYQSLWRNKPSEILKIELKQVLSWAETLDKYAQKDHLKSNDKIDILNGLLLERGEV